jgi:hypothetical protein
MPTVKIEGTELELPDDICKSDQKLRDALVAFYPGAANSDVKRDKKGDKEVITVTKRAGSKGSSAPVVEALDAAPEWIHPALVFDVKGWRKTDAEALERAMLEALESLAEVERVAGLLDSAAPLPAPFVPEGF